MRDIIFGIGIGFILGMAFAVWIEHKVHRWEEHY